MTEITDLYVLTVETSGNQPFIFASNKLREQIGASELVRQATTVWLLEALGWPDPTVAEDPVVFHNALRDQRPIEDGANCEIVQAPSGRSIVLFCDHAEALAVGRGVTERALRRAPGLDVSCGIAGFDWSTEGALAVAIDAAARDRARWAAAAPGPLARHLRLPIVADCRTTGFPAAARDSRAPDATTASVPERSAAARAKRQAAPAGVARMATTLTGVPGRVAANPDELLRLLERALEDDDRIGWVAVVHADANSIGRRFTDLASVYADRPNRDYLRARRDLSLQVDAAAVGALRAATSQLLARDQPDSRDTKILPLVPFVVGGDDLTVLLAGGDALRFVCEYLRVAAADGLVCRAGIAFVKPHFPLHSAYALSSDLADEAKRAKAYDVPAFDFHLLYDTGVPELTAIRAAMRVDCGRTRLHGRPYVVTESTPRAGWVSQHLFAELERAAATVEAPPAGSADRALPHSQLSALRAALRGGRRLADEQLRLVAHRYPDALKEVTTDVDGRPSLFIDDDGEAGTRFTRLPDVIDLIELAGLPSLQAVASSEPTSDAA